jgi:hypothetical protein
MLKYVDMWRKFFASDITTIIVCCVALFIVLFVTQPTSSSHPSPRGEGRCCIANTNFVTTTSTLYLYSSFSGTPIIIGISEKRGLCVGGLLLWRRAGPAKSGIGMRSLSTKQLLIYPTIVFF